MTKSIAICCDCGAWCFEEELALSCGACGSDWLDLTTADEAGRERLLEAWAAGVIGDLSYERGLDAIAEAVDEAIAETQAEWDRGAGEVVPAVEPAPADARPYVRLRLRAVSLSEAKAYVKANHRHNRAPVSWVFGLGVEDEAGELRGVIMVGRPVARMIATRQPGTLEVTRLCTDGTPNAGSMLLGAARRACRKLRRAHRVTKLISYILESESGVCYRAAGWSAEALSKGGSWDRKGRPREDKAPTCRKVRFAIAV